MSVELLRPDATAAELAALERAFEDLYRSMRADGLQADLVEGGAQVWSRSVLPMLGRITCIACAWRGPVLQGFAVGTVRVGPAHLGAKRSGAITHIHVDAALRGTGLGRVLFTAVEDWFRTREVVDLELEVLPGNTGAQAFWERLGFRADHMVMRRPIG
jgi:ribosomal protein S18 acetylase RimI-like enzyme